MMPTHAHTLVPILLYHSVSDRPAMGQEAFTVRPAAFREHVGAISQAGRTALSVSEFASALRGERLLPSQAMLVTFDDGFADTRAAVELLLDAGLTSSVFVASGSIGKRAMLTSSGVRDLAGLIEVGAHSVTHPRLDELDGAQATQEIRSSKATLEDLIGAPVHSFAYPHGAYDRRVRAAVVDADFGAAAAVKNALSHDQDDPYALARVTVMASTSIHEVEMLLAGSGAPEAWRRERLRTRSYRVLRRLKRQIAQGAATWR